MNIYARDVTFCGYNVTDYGMCLSINDMPVTVSGGSCIIVCKECVKLDQDVDVSDALMKMNRENLKLGLLLKKAVKLANKFCDEQEKRTCPAWPDHSVSCELNEIEDEMKELGIEVNE